MTLRLRMVVYNIHRTASGASTATNLTQNALVKMRQ